MTCEIIMDLIPMYADKTASEETAQLVESHIKSCPECKRFLRSCQKTEKKSLFSKQKLDKIREKLRGTGTDIPSVDTEFALLSSRLKKRKLRKIIIGTVFATGMLAYIIIDVVNAIKRRESDNGGNR